MVSDETNNKNTNRIWIGLGAAALFCLCAAAVAVFVFYKIGERVKDTVKTDPEAASQAAHEIADYTLPRGYREQMSMNIVFYSFVMIGPESSITGGPLIMLAQFDSSATDPEQMKQQIRQSFEQQSGRNGTNMKLVEVKKMTIRGEETDVALYEGTDQNGTSIKQLIASFPGKDGTALLMVMGDGQNWDQNMIDDFIQSIH